ncbi:MAG: hypothetical protein EOO73_03540 [Myxococcales bacterium]|nr:MAG: hypothetical protein EOO73_03540 [Myxococcales bacterium]
MSELANKLAYRNEIRRHLAELTRLLGREVRADELLSLEDTQRVRGALNGEEEPSRSFVIPFDDKSSPRWALFVSNLSATLSGNVYLWTPASNECGLLRPVPLGAVDFTFEFETIPEGIVSIVSEELGDRMVLDFSEEAQQGRVLEVEQFGETWGKVAY